MRRRELIKKSLLGDALSSPLVRTIFAAEAAEPIVETKCGEVRGVSADGVQAFKGIHYAASTDGAARFIAQPVVRYS
ncbi:MAG TPA: hypothetical protein VEJ45_02835 [Candidatus Acidoferrales bacterium]|nr:hypothetical protein [Candidatus Acidoferrales bacterium]